MPYEIKKVFTYANPFEEVYKAAYLTIKELGGKIAKHDLANKQLIGQMDKKFKGEMLGDRSRLEMTFSEDADGNTTISVYAYPLNAVGQKLMFGARKGVVETVISGYFQEVEKKLTG
jgi:hypothetical protein